MADSKPEDEMRVLASSQPSRLGSGQRRIYSLLRKLFPGLTLNLSTFYNRPKASSAVGASDTSWEISATGPDDLVYAITSRMPFYSFFQPGVTCVSASLCAHLGSTKIEVSPLDSRGLKKALASRKYPYTDCKIHFDKKGMKSVFVSLSGGDRDFWIAATGVEKTGATSKTVGNYSMFRRHAKESV